MSKHTQGPWEVSKHGVPEGIYQAGIYAGDGNDLAIVKTSAADAALIAAAPDLLAALYAARDRMIGNGPAMTALRAQTDAALAKAQS